MYLVGDVTRAKEFYLFGSGGGAGDGHAANGTLFTQNYRATGKGIKICRVTDDDPLNTGQATHTVR